MNAARFYTGQTFEAFLASAVKYKELWESTTKRVKIPEPLVAELDAIGGRWHLAVLNEDWCIDAITIVPAFARLAELSASADLRVFGRDANLDLMDAHLTNGGRSIPLAIVYDEEWNDRGQWGPRPAPLQEWVRKIGLTIPKEEKYREIRTWNAHDHGQTGLRELIDLIANTTKK